MFRVRVSVKDTVRIGDDFMVRVVFSAIECI